MKSFSSWTEELRRARQGKLLGSKMDFFRKLDSTSLKARREALKGAAEGLLILADGQFQGKGRMGRGWLSPPGLNLYFSTVLRPPVSPAAAPQITLLAGVAGAKSLARVSGLEVRIKWPNDLFIGGKKAAGILCEMEVESRAVRFVILGIGVNVNWRRADMPAELQDMATSLREEAGREFSRAAVAGDFLEELEREYLRFREEGFSARLREEWNGLSLANGRRAAIRGAMGTFGGKVLGLDGDGALLLEDDRGRKQRLVAGEVSLRV